jgi:hypothetical protein
MPTKRQASLTLFKSDSSKVTLVADFDQLTLTRTQTDGYQSEPNGPKPITPASAEAFWKQLEQLAAKGIHDGGAAPLDGELWRFTACDGKKTYEGTGVMLTDMTTGDLAPDSGADLCALFDLLKS